MEHKVISFEIKSTTEDGSEGEGYGNAFHMLDEAQEIVAPGAFDDTLAQFLADGFIGGLNHDWDNPIGSPTKAATDKKGLVVGWKISDTAHGRDVKVLLKDRVIKKLSIGYKTLGYERLEDEKAVRAYWQMHGYTPDAADVAKAQYGARLLTKLHLYEVSPVTVPANRGSDITTVKSFNADDLARIADFEDLLRDAAGMSRKEAKAHIARFKTLLRDAGSNEDTPSVKAGVNAPDTLGQFRLQVERLKLRHLSRAGEISEQISGTH